MLNTADGEFLAILINWFISNFFFQLNHIGDSDDSEGANDSDYDPEVRDVVTRGFVWLLSIETEVIVSTYFR